MPWLIGLVFALATVAASAGRLTTFAWDAGANWPPGTTVELCGNGNVCQTGIMDTWATLDLPVNPGDLIQGQARAVAPAGYQCGDPPTPCPYSEWAMVAQTWPAPGIGLWATKESNQVAAPTLNNYYASNWTDRSGSDESVTGVAWSAGDVIVVIGIAEDTPITLSTPTNANLIFSSIASVGIVDACRLYAWSATAGSSQSSQTITSTINGTIHQRGLGVFVFSGSAGIGASTTSGGSKTSAVTLSLTRSYDNSFVIWVLGDWAATNDTTVSSIPSSGATQRQASYYPVAATFFLINWTDQGSAGATAYGISGFAGTSADHTMLAVEVRGVTGGATALPRRAIDGPFYGALQGSVR